MTIKMTVVGRPGQIQDNGTYITTCVESNKVPALPKGLPALANAPKRCVVSIAAKQWRRVAEAIADPDDSLIIEGYPTIDEQNMLIALSATSVKSRKQDMAAREKPRETPQG